MWPGKYTFSLSNKLSVRVSASKKQTTQHTLDRVIGGECNRGTLRWNRVRGAPGSENNGTLFSLQGLKCWGNQNPDTERTVERAPDGNWLPGWGIQPDLCDSMAHCSHSSASVRHPKRWPVPKGSRTAWEPVAVIHFSQPSRARNSRGKGGE